MDEELSSDLVEEISKTLIKIDFRENVKYIQIILKLFSRKRKMPVESIEVENVPEKLRNGFLALIEQI